MSLENFNRMTFDLLEATVSLYCQNDSGGAGALVATDLLAEHLRITEKWLVVQTRPSGAQYPVNHPLVPEYTVNIGRLLAYDLANPAGLQMSGQTYVLDVIWTDESGIGWHRATLYGVTITNRDSDARDVESGIMDNLEFAAQYLVPDGAVNPPTSTLEVEAKDSNSNGQPNLGLAASSWTGPTIPPPSALPPLYVRYLDGDGNNILLYTFAASPGEPNLGLAGTGPTSWTAQASTTNTAVIAQDSFGDFSVTFSGHAAPALSLAASDGTEPRLGILRMALLDAGGTPDAGDLPRLDFYSGSTRIGSVTERGILFCALLMQVTSPETDSGFLLGGSATGNIPVAAAWRADGLQVQGVEEFFPTDPPSLGSYGGQAPSALLAWHRMESLAASVTGQTVSLWPDETVNAHALAASGGAIGPMGPMGPMMDFVDGVRAVGLGGGDYFHCGEPNLGLALFDTSAFQMFVVACRALGAAGVPVAGFGPNLGLAAAASGSVRWYAGKQSALLQAQPGPAISVTGSLVDGNEWSIYELQKGATGSSLRLNGQLDGFTAHGAFGAAQDYFFCGTGDSVTGGGSATGHSTFDGWVRQGLVYGRELTAVEADQVRMWLRANLNLQ